MEYMIVIYILVIDNSNKFLVIILVIGFMSVIDMIKNINMEYIFVSH